MVARNTGSSSPPGGTDVDDELQDVSSEIAQARQAAYTDTQVQAAVKARVIAQAGDYALQVLNAKRNALYNAAKDNSELLRLQSGITAGFRYSFSGADARAYAYYPAATERIKRDREQLKQKLVAAEKRLQGFDIGKKKNSLPDPNQIAAAAEYSALAGMYSVMPTEWLPLESLSTISINVHEPRSVVRALGHKGIKGYAGSVRTIAGTIIFTVVEHHPLRELMIIDEELNSSWSIDHYLKGRGTLTKPDDKYSKTATMLSPFNIAVTYVSECDYGSTGGVSQFIDPKGYSATVELEGVQLISQGLVTSVNDVVTELQYQFIASDIREFAGNIFAGVVEKSAIPSYDNLTDLELMGKAGISYNEYKAYLEDQTGTSGSAYQDIVNQEVANAVRDIVGNTPSSPPAPETPPGAAGP